jgi:hypothetical protein
MTTREEYAEAAKWIGLQVALPGEEKPALLAARVLRALADGAVLEYPKQDFMGEALNSGDGVYRP